MLLSKEIDTVSRVSIRDEADCISVTTNTLVKGMNSIILRQAKSKLQGNSVL